MLRRKKIIITAALAGVVFAAITFVPPLLRYAARGTPVVDYIRQHGQPTASAETIEEFRFQAHGLVLRGVQLHTETTDAKRFIGRLLVYPESKEAVRHFRYLPNREPNKGVRSVHYSQRRLLGDEHLVLVRIDATGRVADVESRSYNWLEIWENPSLTQP